MKKKRMKPANRRKEIIQTALKVAECIGLHSLTQAEVAKACGVSEGTIQYHFCSMEKLKWDVVRLAIEKENAEVVAQAWALRHPGLKGINRELLSLMLSKADF